jgi:hypothetical protein
MGYRDVEDTADHGLFQFHKLIRPMTKDNLGELYIHGRWGLVQSKVLILVYDIRHRLSPKVLNSMVGNFDEIHAFFLIDLLYLTHMNKGKGLMLDMMDCIWNELQWAISTGRLLPMLPM